MTDEIPDRLTALVEDYETLSRAVQRHCAANIAAPRPSDKELWAAVPSDDVDDYPNWPEYLPSITDADRAEIARAIREEAVAMGPCARERRLRVLAYRLTGSEDPEFPIRPPTQPDAVSNLSGLPDTHWAVVGGRFIVVEHTWRSILDITRDLEDETRYEAIAEPVDGWIARAEIDGGRSVLYRRVNDGEMRWYEVGFVDEPTDIDQIIRDAEAEVTSCGSGCYRCAGDVRRAAEILAGFSADTLMMTGGRMFVCPQCGNKRCPKATFHGNECTGSNESGQPGSRYQ